MEIPRSPRAPRGRGYSRADAALEITKFDSLVSAQKESLQMKWFTSVMFALISSQALGASIFTSVPEQVDASKNYLIYLHGAIIEKKGPKPIDSRFGVYDYPGILDALSRSGDVVISQAREPDTDVNRYSGIVIAEIYKLIKAGVPQGHIAVVGFSKGGDIAEHVSSFLRMKDIRYVLLAACWPKPDEPQLRLTGHIFSVYEESDTLAGFSCRPLTAHADKPTSFEELKISTGLSHGAFYRPREEWLVPVIKYLHDEKR